MRRREAVQIAAPSSRTPFFGDCARRRKGIMKRAQILPRFCCYRATNGRVAGPPVKECDDYCHVLRS
ncbi:hypothetical protein ABTA60_19550, partial [Acinetobacter baumannii]